MAARLSLSDVVALLLTRGSGDRDSVTITRNTRGVSFEVTARTRDGETIRDAEREARTVFESLSLTYPQNGES